MIFLMVVLVSLIIVQNHYERVEIREELYRTQMLVWGLAGGDDVSIENKKIEAFNVPNKYSCVMTYDRDWEVINKSQTHEDCHQLIEMDREHFCGVNNEYN